MPRLQDKVALVTGAAHGIGEAIARRFAAEGAAVLLADIDGDGAERVADELQSQGARAGAVHADVTSSADLERMVNRAVEQFGALDILVNNAAVTYFGRGLDAEDFESRFDLLMATNIKSVWMALRFAAPHLRARGGGSVINIASVQGIGGADRNSAYAATKGALISGTRSLAVELASSHIRVNCISPGSISTRAPGEWMKKRFGPEIYEEFAAQFGNWPEEGRKLSQPLPLVGLPDDVAHCAVYLASDEARFCTGANFVIDGGMTALLADPGSRSQAADEHHAKRAEVREWIENAKQRAAENVAAAAAREESSS